MQASLTALETAGTTRESNGDGDVFFRQLFRRNQIGDRLSGRNLDILGNPVAFASKAPRKMLGKANRLLTWFGKSERPGRGDQRSALFRFIVINFRCRVR